MNYNKHIVFAASCVVIFIFGISIITLGATLPQLSAEYQLTEIDKGTLASLLPFGLLVGSLLFGPIVDKYSYKYFLTANVLLILIGFIVIAVGKTFLLLAVAFVLIGTGGGAINGASSALVADLSSDHQENKGANLSLMGTFFGLGALGMPLILSLLSSWLDYRQIIGGIGLFMIFPIIFLLIIRYPAPKQISRISFTHIGKLIRKSILIILSLILFFQSGWESLVNNWVTTYLIEQKHTMEARALGLLTFFVAVFTIGRFVLGFLLQKFNAKLVLLSLSIMALIGSIFLSYTSSELAIILSLTLIGFGLAAGFPVVLGIIGDQFASWSGTAFGIAFTIALCGNIIINYITGLVTNAYQIGAYSWVLISSGLGTTMLIIFSLTTFTKKQ